MKKFDKTPMKTGWLVAVYLSVDSKFDLQSNDMHFIGLREGFSEKPR